MLNRLPFAHWLRDRSEKPGEDLCKGFVPDLKQIAAQMFNGIMKVESPK